MVKDSMLFHLTEKAKVLEPFAKALGAGFTEAARNSVHQTAFATCTAIEPGSLSGMFKPGAPVIGIETRYEAGVIGPALLAITQSDLARIAELCSAGHAGKSEPSGMEACRNFLTQSLEAAGKSLAQFCGLAVRGSELKVVNPDGDYAPLQRLEDAYSDAHCLTVRMNVENRPEFHVQVIVHRDLQASLNSQLPQYSSAAASRGNSHNRWNIDLILDVELEVAVSFGETQMPLRDVLKLGVGSVIELERGVNDPVTILVNEKPIARGEVVMVDGNYGVKVLEVESTADRIRSLG